MVLQISEIDLLKLAFKPTLLLPLSIVTKHDGRTKCQVLFGYGRAGRI